jgi:hypothetical protein
MVGHRVPSNICRSRIIIDAGDAYIELIEEFPCENREQLSKREGEIIRERECVNWKIPGKTREEYNKEWYVVNKQRRDQQVKDYYSNNTEAIKQWRKEYYEVNKEAINARKKATRALKTSSPS